jgi:hemin uptake protein HemP
MNEYVVLESKKLFGSDKIVKILHNGNIYVLRITKDNKLILTK